MIWTWVTILHNDHVTRSL